ARAAVVEFQLTEENGAVIGELCDRLDGLPLALELAAARAAVLTPQQMLALVAQRFEFLVSRRRDVAARHRSVRAAIASSFQLLTPELRQFFTHLSVFRGGWTLEAAAAVCGEEGVQAFRTDDNRHASGYPEPLNARTPERLTLDRLQQLR